MDEIIGIWGAAPALAEGRWERKVDALGRVVIPAELRRELGLEAGGTAVMEGASQWLQIDHLGRIVVPAPVRTYHLLPISLADGTEIAGVFALAAPRPGE